jgi:hypothetical protein
MIQNNKAVVFRIKSVRKHSNADRLNCTDIFGYNVIIGPNVKVGDLGIYFPEEVQLSPEFCAANNLVRTKDAEGKPSGGMFEENRRVKTIKLRGERSEGFWIPISALSSFGDVSTLKELDCFDVFGGKEICRKYVARSNYVSSGTKNSSKQQKPESIYMKRHMDTAHFKPNIGALKVGDLLHVSEKIHGTSTRNSMSLEEEKLSRFRAFIYKLAGKFLPLKLSNWVLSHGSRNVVLGDNCDKLRGDIKKAFEGKLHCGEAVYGECAGFDGGMPIMNTVDNSKLGKEFVAQYGKQTVWHYGTQPGQFRLFIYRITQTSEDGNTVELSVSQVKRRCEELGIEYVPHFTSVIYDGDEEKLLKLVEQYSSGQSTVATHWREGCVVRVDSISGRTYFLKEKNFEFKCLEGIIRDTGTEDLEENS